MLIRIIAGAGCGLFALGLAFITDTPALPVIAALLSLACEFELQRCLGTHRRPVSASVSYILAAGAPLAAGFASRENFSRFALSVVAVYLFVTASAYTFSVGRGSKKGAENFEQAASSGFFTLYIALGFSALVLICGLENGRIIFPLVFIAGWGTDVFAYFSGFFFGRHKLIPEVSPKKTVEGAIGGTLICTLMFVAYGAIAGVLGKATGVHLIPLIVLGALSSAVAQAGDLIMSAVKREFGLKDFGKTIPGHGGFLDRFDSVLAVSSVFYLFLTAVSMFE